MAMTYEEAKQAFMGIDVHYTTYKLHSGIDGADHEGQLLALTGIGEAGVSSDTNAPIGVLKKYESDGHGSVQDRGYAEISIHNEADPADELAYGNFVEVDGAGKGAKSATYKGVICIASDKTAHKAIIKLS